MGNAAEVDQRKPGIGVRRKDPEASLQLVVVVLGPHALLHNLYELLFLDLTLMLRVIGNHHLDLLMRRLLPERLERNFELRRANHVLALRKKIERSVHFRAHHVVERRQLPRSRLFLHRLGWCRDLGAKVPLMRDFSYRRSACGRRASCRHSSSEQ
eukprot:Amastigsp_a682106_9.p4 type:complete len:156 gc:universal Amastigsp_a682106_9:498-31(-)